MISIGVTSMRLSGRPHGYTAKRHQEFPTECRKVTMSSAGDQGVPPPEVIRITLLAMT